MMSLEFSWKDLVEVLLEDVNPFNVMVLLLLVLAVLAAILIPLHFATWPMVDIGRV